MTSSVLDGVWIDEQVHALRPDYRVGLVEVSGLHPAPSDTASEALLCSAEEFARDLVSRMPVEEIPHIAAWRDAYRAFGAKPQRTRNSLEALVRRAVDGLPRVNRLTDIYNAISVMHLIPLGGEDLDHYAGVAHLVRADGTEPFDTFVDGEVTIESPEPGEVVWRDDHGVTCRRWNWRQGIRTRLTDDTTHALFILDALEPMLNEALTAAMAQLAHDLGQLDGDIRVNTRLIGAEPH